MTAEPTRTEARAGRRSGRAAWIGIWLAVLTVPLGCNQLSSALDGVELPAALTGAEPAQALPPVSAPPRRGDAGVSALGRLEPEDGIRRIAGPSGSMAVIAKLEVDEGDAVEQGQVLAVLDTEAIRLANITRWKAELANAKRELARYAELNISRVASDSSKEDWETRVRISQAELTRARADLARSYVRSPIDGHVLYVHAREGELVGPEGILELGRTGSMFAVAEVYEDDIGRVKVGQKATVSSPALAEDLTGQVDWIHMKVAKQDALGTDPAARKDARVVEVEIRLDDSAPAASLTNLQVEVEIEP